MRKHKVCGNLLHETLTQVSLELEAAAQAARDAARCIADGTSLWAHIQRMYARLNQANYFVGRLTILSEGVGTRSPASNRHDKP